MLLGHPPFEAESADDVLRMHIRKDPPQPRQLAPELEITPAAEALILKSLSKDPQHRHQSMDEFRAELKLSFGATSYRYGLKKPPGVSANAGPRAKRLTEEIEEWLRTDSTCLSLEQARKLVSESN